MNRCFRTLLLLWALAGAGSAAIAQQVIVLRTGQTAGVPGQCGTLDDTFRYNPINMAPCPQPFRTAPFTVADFTGAATGPAARVVNPYTGFWLPTLPSDPQARWINWQLQPGSCFGEPRSVLYAARFLVDSPCATSGRVDVCWAVDDFLGDPSGPNPIGIYINGVALNPSFSGGNYATQTCASQINVPLNPGLNVLYAYQRDGACTVSGLLLSARITVNPAGCPNILVHKFHDVNGNGIQDGGEPDLPNWTFNLTGPVNLTGTTGPNGTYQFSCVPVGNYVVTEVTQPGWVVTTPPGGSQVLTVDCGQEYAVEFGNRLCQQSQVPCVQLPSCLVSWYPFNECGGVIANEVVANRDGWIIGGNLNPTWGPGRWGSPCGLRIPGTPGTSVVQVPNYPEHNFGTGSFTLFAWVRTLNGDANPHVILDKRVPPFMSPTGYSMYYQFGRLRFQYADGSGGFTTHVSTGPMLNDGNWHTVAVTVCRNPANPSTNVTRLIVDNYVDAFTSGIPTGSLSNTAGLWMGDQSPGFLSGVRFDGAIDDVLIFKGCCLTPNQVFALRTDFQYCHDKCSVPSIVSTFGSTVTTTLTLCNYSLTPQTYSWTIAGLPAGAGCSVAGPTSYSPAGGTVTIPAATSGPSCVNIPIVITLPAGMSGGQTACYQVTTQNLATGRCCTTRGRVRKNWWIDPTWNPAKISLPPGQPAPLALRIYNASASFFDITYRIEERSEDGDDSNRVVSLNGLPPGVPVLGSLSIPPDGTGEVPIEAVLTEFQPLNIHEVVLLADLDGDGTPEDLAVASLESYIETDASDAPEVPPATAPGAARTFLSAAPNPFHDGTTIRLALDRAQSGVRLEIYDVGGRLIRTVFSGSLPAGVHTLAWDGRDDVGRSSPAGLYFLQARTADSTFQRKLIRIE